MLSCEVRLVPVGTPSPTDEPVNVRIVDGSSPTHLGSAQQATGVH
jgi:hypothetical protein